MRTELELVTLAEAERLVHEHRETTVSRSNLTSICADDDCPGPWVWPDGCPTHQLAATIVALHAQPAKPVTWLWLDDVRPAPAGWTHVRSVNAAVRELSSGSVVRASLDHDLGDYEADGGDGIKVLDWMAEHDVWPAEGVTVHSANPVGRDRMLVTIRRYGPY